MSKVTKQDSTAADGYLDHIFGVVRENEGFLYNNAGEPHTSRECDHESVLM
jgi:hypothetical protein